MVPVFGFGDNFIGSEKSDGEHLGTGVLLSGILAAEDEILSDLG